MIHERSDLDSDSFSEQANHDGWSIRKWKLHMEVSLQGAPLVRFPKLIIYNSNHVWDCLGLW